jgi:CPA1 family monovalent cation:H+ antiporter
MEFTITSVLSLFTLLALASGVFYAARQFRLPYTVLLVAVGIALVPVVNLPVLGSVFGFLDDLQLTPELLFYIFLPVLIFESGYSMSIRKMLDSAWTISLLAVVGLLVSAFGSAALLYLILQAVGAPVPFTVLLLFGAIISATDPVAVLALFKDFGAPRRLSIIFEGESLFNDGTAVALFLVVLGVAGSGFHGVSTVLAGVTAFVVMVLAGVLLGLGGASLLGVVLRRTRANEFVSATLLIISAHLVFITGELINEQGWSIGGIDLRVSSIIAATISSLFLGNYARHSLTPRTDAYVDKAVSHLAFVANSLVFLLAGLLFASTEVHLADLWLVMVLSVLVVATMRAVSVYAVTGPVNRLHIDAGVSSSWQKILAFGSLRGALAIIVVLLIPPDFVVPGWGLESTPREFMLALTISCILTTLFLKAPFIGPLMRRLNIDQPEPVEVARRADLAVYYLLAERAAFEDSETRGLVRDEHYRSVVAGIDRALAVAVAEREALAEEYGIDLFERALRLTAIGVEESTLAQQYVNGEVGELTYRRLHGKLQLQIERIEGADLGGLDPHRARDRKDVFDMLVHGVLGLVTSNHAHRSTVELLESWRAQMIMSRRVVKVLNGMQSEFPSPVYLAEPFGRVLAAYQGYQASCAEDLDRLATGQSEVVGASLGRIAEQSRHASGLRAVALLRARGIAQPADEDWLTDRFASDHAEGYGGVA